MIIYKSICKGIVKAPPSKSYAHRAIICAGLGGKKCKICNIEFSDDILATLSCITTLGARYEKINENEIIIYGIDIKNIDYSKEYIFNCNECGSTYRFFIPIALAIGIKCKFIGSKKLLSRPIDVYEKIFKEKNIKYIKNENELQIINGKLEASVYEIRGDVSSQFITGLIFALSILDKESIIKVLPPIESASYIDITIDIMFRFGLKVETSKVEDNLIIKINKNFRNNFIESDYCIEEDFSNAAFLEALNAYSWNDVQIENLTNVEKSKQGDKIFLEYFKKIREGDAQHTSVDIANCPDLGPILFVYAALMQGAKFTSCKRLQIKESNRIMAMQEELKHYNVDISISKDFDTVIVHKCNTKYDNENINSHNDHRIVMSMAIMALGYGGKIENHKAVNKSFPSFFNVIEHVGGKIDYEMDI